MNFIKRNNIQFQRPPSILREIPYIQPEKKKMVIYNTLRDSLQEISIVPE